MHHHVQPVSISLVSEELGLVLTEAELQCEKRIGYGLSLGILMDGLPCQKVSRGQQCFTGELS
jgi:hypothetical protein